MMQENTAITLQTTHNQMERTMLPPGFRFHPQDHELLEYYLAPKVQDANFSVLHIGDVDLNRCEPWDLPGMAKMGEKEWYFFASRDRKYPTGKRTNRATEAGYWKATGKDKEVMSSRSSSSSSRLLGMKKTLVFYQGRAPKGAKTNWIMHEYRLESDCPDYSNLPKDSEWIICRIYKKNSGGKIKTHIEDTQTSNIYSESEALNGLPPLESPHPTASKDPGFDSDASLPDDHVTEFASHVDYQNGSISRSNQSYVWEPSIQITDTFAPTTSVTVSDHLNALPDFHAYSYEDLYNNNQQFSHEAFNLSVDDTGKMRQIRPPSLIPPPFFSHTFDPSSSKAGSDQLSKAVMDYHMLSRQCKAEPDDHLGISENPAGISSYRIMENTFVGDNACLDIAAKDLSVADQTVPYSLFQSTTPASWWI